MNHLDEILIAKYISGQLSEEEKNTLDNLIKNDPEIQKELDESVSIWNTSFELGKKENSGIKTPNIKEQLAKMNDKIGVYDTSKVNHLDKILIAKYISGQLSEEEKNTLDNLIKNDPEVKKELDESVSIWNTSFELGKKENSRMKIPNVKEQLAKMNEKIDGNNTSKVKPFIVTKNKQPKFFAYKIAAAISFLILVSWGIYFSNTQNTDSDYIAKIELSTSSNEKKEVKLSDGTIVWLNKNTQFSYPKTFGKDKRVVELIGEAFFEVAKDPSKPFIIIANSTETKVLGTSFNLNTNNNKVELAVMTGKVAFSTKSGEKSVNVTPNQIAIFSASSNQIAKQEIKVNDFAGWRNNTIFFNDATLNDVVKSLEKWYNVKIKVKSSEIGDIKFTAPCKDKSLNEVLDLINETTGVKYSKNSDLIILSN